MARSRETVKQGAGVVLLRRILALLLAVGLLWFGTLYLRIERVADWDEAQFADAIAVFGAAQYAGHPSPVFRARLDHAAELYTQHIAPLVIVLGGSGQRGGEPEGQVGRDYLLAQGVPYQQIVAETESVDTAQQAQELARIGTRMQLQKFVVVSDGVHLFRVRRLCQDAGLEVYTSPRPIRGRITTMDATIRVWHEMLSYTALVLHVDDLWMVRWLEGHDDA